MDTIIELTAQPHPNPQIRRVGFDLTDPYVEQCWGAILGPSGVAILRRLPVMWSQEEPLRVDSGDLGRSLGIGSPKAGGARVIRTLDRLEDFGLARWTDPDQAIQIYTHVPALTDRQLDRLPAWTHRAHHSLLAAHIDGLHAAQTPLTITQRLDLLEEPALHEPPSIGLGR